MGKARSWLFIEVGKNHFDRFTRINKIKIFHCQAECGCLPVISSAYGGETFQPLIRGG